ncbi:hypothetical protein [Enterococcus sp. DIV0187]|uniref:hypothetical protein n=1 Tax=Enterococcus sp. DIV0187 TaxID=2774644 RepID=UPI003F2953FC
MKSYLDDWRVIQGSLNEDRINALPSCLEKEHQFKIREMLSDEGYESDEFFVREYPRAGVYIICRENQEDYFTIYEENGDLTPIYVTKEVDEEGKNCFPCKEIATAIALTEC